MKIKRNIEGMVDDAKLTNLLRMKENQYRMLNNTLDELMGGNIDKIIENREKIKAVNNEMTSTLNEIEAIKGEMCSVKEPEYSFYDTVEKKASKPQYDYKNRYDDKFKSEKNYIDEINDTIDSRESANRFLVHLEKHLGIPSTMVKSVSFDSYNKEVIVDIYSFVTKGGYPIIAALTSHIPLTFDFSIDHLDAKANVTYREIYEECQIENLVRSGLDYYTSDFSTISIVISYGDVTYEAA